MKVVSVYAAVSLGHGRGGTVSKRRKSFSLRRCGGDISEYVRIQHAIGELDLCLGRSLSTVGPTCHGHEDVQSEGLRRAGRGDGHFGGNSEIRIPEDLGGIVGHVRRFTSGDGRIDDE